MESRRSHGLRNSKIRCNRADPCSNCQTSGITCRPASKTTEHRPRVLLSANYEKQIELINERLVGIERSLKALALDKPHSSPSIDHDPPTTSTSASVPSEQSGPTAGTPLAFEGASSFTDQALRASQAAELSAGSVLHSAEVSDALVSLRQVLGTIGFPAVSYEMHFEPGSSLTKTIPEMELLPASFVISCLKNFRNRASALLLAFALRDHTSIDRICQKVYFPTEPVTLGTLTVMHGLLYYLLKEITADDLFPELAKSYDVTAYLNLCEKNFHIGIESYEVLVNPTLDNAKALTLAVSNTDPVKKNSEIELYNRCLKLRKKRNHYCVGRWLLQQHDMF